MNRSGDIRLKAYNETNDRYYTRTNLTTQGIGIIFKKDFNHWNELMFWNKWKLKLLKRKPDKNNVETGQDNVPQEASQEKPMPANASEAAQAKLKRGEVEK